MIRPRSRLKQLLVHCLSLCAVGATLGCDGQQSALAPAGRGAEEIASLFWWMVTGGALIWIVVIGLAIYALRIAPQPHNDLRAKLWIIGGGTIVPTIVLALLLTYGLAMLPPLLARPVDGSLKIEVTGIQWWWRVRYLDENSQSDFELANEIHLPVGKPVEFELKSADVVHSFWIPSLGGKIDMIPGRQTRLTLEPTKTGTYRGVCAEYCGTGHAQMCFYVIVMEQAVFDEWLARQRETANQPLSNSREAEGQRVFVSNGCGACHTIRGTAMDGVIGPDLTHVGSRASLGAGIMKNEPAEFVRWIAQTEQAKPGVHMPEFGMLSDQELQALAAYLESLQ